MSRSTTLNTRKLKQAIRLKKDGVLTYHKLATGRVVKRRVTPHEIRDGLLFAYDHKRKALRSYKLERIKSMRKVAFWTGFEKRAVNPGAVGSLLSGYYTGVSTAGATANALSSHGSKTTNESLAKNVAKVLAPIGAIGGIALSLKHRPAIISALRRHVSAHPDMEGLYHMATPFVAGTLGGMAAGAATGAAASLRKRASLAHAAEIAGLGILARPAIQEMRGKHVTEQSKRHHELAGLGVLAAPSAVHLAHAGYTALRKHLG